MNLLCAFAAVLAFLALLFDGGGAVVGKRRQAMSRRVLTNPRGASLGVRLQNELQEAEAKRQDQVIRDMFRQCFYHGQQATVDGDATRDPQDILQQMCQSDLHESNSGRIARSQHHKGTSHTSRKRRARALYNIIGVAIMPEATAHSSNSTQMPDSSGGDPSPTDPAQSAEASYSEIYRGLLDASPEAAQDDALRKITPIASYYLKSERFAHFLNGWKVSSENAEFHITQADVDLVRSEVESGTPYQELSEHNKLLFAKLLLVRNGFESFSILKAARNELGLHFRVCMTADSFLRALHGYFMTVHGSGGSLPIDASVAITTLSTDLFSLAYVHCDSTRVYLVENRNGERQKTEFGRVFADKARLFIKHLVIVFLAWAEHTGNELDPRALARVGAKVDAFFPEHNDWYEQGCQ
ncbi:hypothetical protein PAPHI01_2405 [Pancytospora philotis]|nr:hypothetical protein PAPHI01_2405 [Pancytospora philotis]